MADASLGMMAVTQGVSAFNAFLPDLATVRKSSIADRETVATVRTGEFAGVAITLAIGAMCSHFSRDAQPVLLALVISAVMVAVYENALHLETP